MLTIQVTCACGHFAKVIDEQAIVRWKPMEPMTFRCSNCGMAGKTDARLAWDIGINPMESAYANGMKGLEGLSTGARTKPSLKS
ncbi:hypothetical protein ETW23_11265 [Leisingera sp. NJS201]|nr:hypothetical protein [Leisingera sp. NJS201]QBR36642.1 hypothetical protein ETW23_11265 [Leisingera sp. NJS201]